MPLLDHVAELPDWSHNLHCAGCNKLTRHRYLHRPSQTEYAACNRLCFEKSLTPKCETTSVGRLYLISVVVIAVILALAVIARQKGYLP